METERTDSAINLRLSFYSGMRFIKLDSIGA